MDDTKLLAGSANKPLAAPDMSAAYARIILALIGPHPELAPEFIGSWLSPALCTMVAFEWMRQFFEAIGPQAFPSRH